MARMATKPKGNGEIQTTVVALGDKRTAKRKSGPAEVAVDIGAARRKDENLEIKITAPNFKRAAIAIRGTSPMVQHKFSEKARNTMVAIQEEGSQSRKGRKRDPKDFNAVYEAAKHVSTEGWCGIPASAFRNAMISACRIVGFKMTLAKLSLFVDADGYGSDGTPLVKITKGEPVQHLAPARNANGSTDIRCRPMWHEWEAKLRLRWDGDQFSPTDIANLLSRVGAQVGIGEGRADSRMSSGMGWGFFELVG